VADAVTNATDASLTASSGPVPVADSKRIDAIDTLRGFAIFGIYAVNIGTFAWPSAAMADPTVMGDTWWNHAGYQITGTALFGKFMFLFSMLFGATIFFFDRKTAPTDRKPRVSDGTGLWARRQACSWRSALRTRCCCGTGIFLRRTRWWASAWRGGCGS
jgi:uncharacterized membrane protein YeiB